MKEEISERLLYQLSKNFLNKKGAKKYVSYAKLARKNFKRCGAEDILDLLWCTDDFENLSFGDIKKVEFFPDEEFVKFYKKRHGIEPVGIGCILGKATWKTLRKKYKDKKFWNEDCAGITFRPLDFKKDKKLYTHKLGLIIIEENNSYDKEHEMLHVDCSVYALGLNLLYKLYLSSKLEEKILYEEAVLTDEINSYRNKIKKEKKWLYKVLLNDYIYEEKKKMKKRIKKEIRKKLKEAIDAAEFLEKNVESKIVTAIFFSLGPTKKMFRKKKLYSPLEDLIYWAELISSKKIEKEKIYNVLKEKGYF